MLRRFSRHAITAQYTPYHRYVRTVSRQGQKLRLLQVVEIPAAHQHRQADDTWPVSATIYTVHQRSSKWEKQNKKPIIQPQNWKRRLELSFHNNVLAHFLPAQYPTSVANGYARFSVFAFAASIAGSAGMVLSTQTLLLAVGVVGSTNSSAPIMAGALNWVLKDGVGQLGGVIFASQMGKTKRFDADPKKWRMTAAMALDTASLIEILSPFAANWAVLPIACSANILKNVGFLTASASRAAIHQSLIRAGNLGDLTAKAGSQSMAAGLLGTGTGIALSTALGHDPNSFIVGFCVLSGLHLGFNYASLKFVSLQHFDRRRLALVLEQFLDDGKLLSPEQVAQRERYFPFLNDDATNSWLSIGSPLETLCPEGPQQLLDILEACPGTRHLVGERGGRIHVSFEENASAEDMVLGVLHAYVLQKQVNAARTMPATIASSYAEAAFMLPSLLRETRRLGWKLDIESISLEPSGAFRLRISSTDGTIVED